MSQDEKPEGFGDAEAPADFVGDKAKTEHLLIEAIHLNQGSEDDGVLIGTAEGIVRAGTEGRGLKGAWAAGNEQGRKEHRAV